MAGLTFESLFLSGEYRPCTVYGNKALFHRWVEEEKLIIKIESALQRKSEYRDIALKDYHKNGIIGPGLSTEKIKCASALVEFEDGHVEKVDPTVIVFDDGYEKFKNLAWKSDIEKFRENENG